LLDERDYFTICENRGSFDKEVLEDIRLLQACLRYRTQEEKQGCLVVGSHAEFVKQEVVCASEQVTAGGHYLREV
jgi:hypothetical protein